MVRHRSALCSSQRGFFTLIGLLAALVIIGILFALYGLPGGLGGSSSGGNAVSVAGGAKQRAEDVVCRNNLSQIRAAISIYSSTNGGYPPSLDALQLGVPMSCPEGGEPYDYDPATGQVHCVHPGHGGF